MHDAVLPLSWIPTRGNDIPPLAVPLHDGLYVARGLLGGEMHIGTTSPSSSGGARLRDRYGRSYDVFEYEVLTCASTVRFQLETPPPATLFEEVTRPTPRWPSHRGMDHRANVTSPDSPRPRAPGKLASFPRLSPPPGRPAHLPSETHGQQYRNDPPPYTGPPGGWVEPPKRPHPMALSRRENVQFEHLTQTKCFALIDDTPSMQYSWSQTRAALTGLVEILSSGSAWDGLDVRFLHHAESRPCIKTVNDFERIFNSVAIWRGEKVMAAKVSQVCADSLAVIHDTRTPKPVNVLIITDGIAADNQDLLDAVMCFCQKLNETCVPPHMFRMHVLQMGDDRKAVKPLHEFRDRITQRDRHRHLLNVVSYHRGRGLLNTQSIFRLLLASTHVPVEEDPDLGERQPPEVIEAQYQELDRIRMIGTR